MFFFQPIITEGNKPLTDEELEMKHAFEGDAALAALCKATYAIAVESPQYPHFHDFRHLFDDHNGLLWIDEFHVTPVGNELIAKAMLHDIEAGTF
jgi:hypothetical protein